MKQEPSTYSWDTFHQEGKTTGAGVRNSLARNDLLALKRGDLALHYHHGEAGAAAGLAPV